MKNKNKLCATVSTLLSEKLPEEQVRQLRDEGYKLKTPTRRMALAIALYKKAEKGDLSAIKELCAMLETEQPSVKEKTVVIVDDITKAPV